MDAKKTHEAYPSTFSWVIALNSFVQPARGVCQKMLYNHVNALTVNILVWSIPAPNLQVSIVYSKVEQRI